MTRRDSLLLMALPFVIATARPLCSPETQPTSMPWEAPLSALWERPANLTDRDLFYGPWGPQHAPDPRAEYTFVRPKKGGINPGLVVKDPRGREWHVKQARRETGDEGPAEVTLSRILSAVGYHQPPVYYLPSFKLRDKSGTHREEGGRFRLHERSMKAAGEWSWQKNPFVGMRPYQGLLVILLMFNSSDLKNSNNTLYDVSRNGGPAQWYVVRDLGCSLGETGRIRPKRNDVDKYARSHFIEGVSHGFVSFRYHGKHGDLIHDRITPVDVGWASHLLGGLTDRQWQDAFRAGGYDAATAARFISSVRARVAEGRQVGGNDWPDEE